MNEEEYNGVILKAKHFQEGPLTLSEMPVGPESTYGYSISDLTFLSKEWAKETNAFYFDVIDFLDAVHKNDQKRIENYQTQLRDKQKIITPPIALFTDDTQKQLSLYWQSIFTGLKKTWQNPLLTERRLVIPVQLHFGKLPSHYAVTCFNFNPSQKKADIIILEQHSQQKGKPDYDPSLDYTNGIKLHADFFGAIINQAIGFQSIDSFVNDKPICRRHNVCGVVASELAKRLLQAGDPMKLAKSGIVINDEKVDKLHKRNQKLEAKPAPSPSMVIQQNGGRK